jgi:hypothetical protein
MAYFIVTVGISAVLLLIFVAFLGRILWDALFK